MKSLLSVFLVIGFSVMAGAQIDDGYFQKRKNKDAQRKNFEDKLNWGDAIYAYGSSHYRPFGWHIDPGVTYMIGNSANDKGQDYNLTPSGLPGYYLCIGMQHLFKKVHLEQDPSSPWYFDWGLGVKHFAGREKYSGSDGTKNSTNFNFGSVFARANFHGVIQLNPWTFIDQSLGVNFDYRIYGGNQFTNAPLGGSREAKPVLGLNYTFGWGLKIRDGFFIIPTLQMPVMKFLSWQGFNPSHVWFNSRYEPLILTVKFGWLFPKKGCPPTFNNGEGKQQSDQYQMR